jgi:hypothetical protein
MTFDDIKRACAESSVEDWCFLTGPMLGEHGARATFKPNPRLVIA